MRAWAQTIIDEMQELLGRIVLREVLGLCPGEPVLHWADNEASTWERLLRLEAAMEGDQGGEEAGPLTGGARGSDDPRPLTDAPAQSPAEVAAEEEHRHQAFLALVHSLTREDEEMPTQPEAEPDSGPGLLPDGSPTRLPLGDTPPELFCPADDSTDEALENLEEMDVMEAAQEPGEAYIPGGSHEMADGEAHAEPTVTPDLPETALETQGRTEDEEGAGVAQCFLTGSASHRRRWSGVMGGEATVRARGGWPDGNEGAQEEGGRRPAEEGEE